MTVDEAKEILLAAPLNPREKTALRLILSEIDCKDLPNEIWRDVIGYESIYQVSNLGRIKSFHRRHVKLLNLETDLNGYTRCGLYKDGKTKHVFVHVLVAQAFIPNPEGKKQVNHISGDKADNRVENLEWLTPSENIVHAFDLGLSKQGCEHGRAKFTAEQIRDIRTNCVPGDSELGFKAFAKKYNVTPRVVQLVYYRKSYINVE